MTSKGPFHQISHISYRFFLTLVDNHTRFSWVFLMKIKSDVSYLIPRFYAMIETRFGAKMKVYRSNNAKELKFTDYFSQIGTLH